jgi:hypothetical protein
MKQILTTLIISLLLMLNLSAQQMPRHFISSAGDEFTNDNISMFWSLGEVLTETFSTNELILTQGFHQVFQQITSDKMDEAELTTIKVYPNPVIDDFSIEISAQVENIQEASYQLSLLDIQGKILLVQNITSHETNINIQDYEPGIYMIHICNPISTKSKVFILQKTNQ